MQRIQSFKLGWQLLNSEAKHISISPSSLRKYSHGPGAFGLLFDIDGVLVRGRTPIPGAKQCFRNLVDRKGRYKVPVVFVTNAGNCMRQTKAEQLSHLLEVEVSAEQVMLSHSPLRMFTQFHNMCVLVSGQGPIKEVAEKYPFLFLFIQYKKYVFFCIVYIYFCSVELLLRDVHHFCASKLQRPCVISMFVLVFDFKEPNSSLGFQNIITIDMLRDACPLLDVVDHNRRPKGYVPKDKSLPQIDAVILFGEPIRWETNIQLIIDVLLTNGQPGNALGPLQYPHIPVLACNMDLLWMAEAKNPRFGHGMFLVCLESAYKKITGYDLQYEALIGKPSVVTYNYAELLVRKQAESLGWTGPVETLYAIGDNPMADIYGANLYNRYLQVCQRARTLLQAQASGKDGSGEPKGAATSEEPPAMTSKELGGVSGMYGIEERLPESCRSVLVCTGVYSGDQQELPPDPDCTVTEQHVFHGHRDFRFDPSLTQPSFLVQDVREAVELVFQQEGCPLE